MPLPQPLTQDAPSICPTALQNEWKIGIECNGPNTISECSFPQICHTLAEEALLDNSEAALDLAADLRLSKNVDTHRFYFACRNRLSMIHAQPANISPGSHSVHPMP
jgi:hypothetical protein